MEKLILLTVVSLLSFSAIYAQSTDRFIRIVGNSDYNFKSNVNRVYFIVSEIAPNEYKKISYKSLESAYAEFVEKLKEVGIPESQIVQTNAEINKYNKTKTRNYYVDIMDQEKLEALSGIQNEGLKVKQIMFLYTNIDENLETKLSLEAIQDAKRKAKKICSELDMRLGKILNIEDKSSGCCSTIEESKKAETNKKYKITITFELLDK